MNAQPKGWARFQRGAGHDDVRIVSGVVGLIVAWHPTAGSAWTAEVGRKVIGSGWWDPDDPRDAHEAATACARAWLTKALAELEGT